MTAYKVYTHPQLGPEAIKEGFSWPAFGFGWIWAYIKRLWGPGTGLLVVQTVLGVFFEASLIEASLSEATAWMYVIALLTLALAVFVGLNGNSWRDASMAGRGFDLAGSVEAESPEGAIALVLKRVNASADPLAYAATTRRKAVGEFGQRPEAGTATFGNEPIVEPSNSDDKHYEQAWHELEAEKKVTSVWARAFSETEGDEAKARARYVALRVSHLRNTTMAVVPEPLPKGTDSSSEPTTDPATVTKVLQDHKDVRGTYEMDFDRLRGSPATLVEHQGPGASHAEGIASPDMASDVIPRKGSGSGLKMLAIAVTLLAAIVLTVVFVTRREEVGPVTDDASAAVQRDQTGIPFAEETEPGSIPEDASAVEEVPETLEPDFDRPSLESSESRSVSPPASLESAATAGDSANADSPPPEAWSGAKEAAWEKFFKPSAACLNPPGWDDYVECVNQKMRAKDVFDKKWAEGEMRR